MLAWLQLLLLLPLLTQCPQAVPATGYAADASATHLSLKVIAVKVAFVVLCKRLLVAEVSA
jgi:hypothetical protein